MKAKKIIFSIILLCTLILITNTNSYAAVAVNGGATWTSITASNSYAACYNMRNGTSSTLGANTLEPHLTLNSDWGAVAYLAVSDFGAVATSTGPSVTLTTNNGPTAGTYTSTTGNASGVMNFGTNYTQTSGLNGGIEAGNTSNLKKNLNTMYVETLSTSNTASATKGQAFAKTSGWYSSLNSYYQSRDTFSLAIRKGILGYDSTSMSGTIYIGSGAAGSTVTFRPVIWNHAK